MTDAPRPCNTHPEITKFRYPLPHLKEALQRQRKIKIVTIGSSSVAGEGSSVMPFPFRLELALRNRYPGRMIDVLGRGIGGQEAPEELARFEPDVLAEQAALVIWQVGSNAIFHSDLYDLAAVARTIATGLSWLKGQSTDVILMDLQYVPALLGANEKNSRHMVSLISDVARDAEVNLFRRFALMEQWCLTDGATLADLVHEGDSLHMSEWATQCVTTALEAATEAAVGPVAGTVPVV
jgi:hypothetical protein